MSRIQLAGRLLVPLESKYNFYIFNLRPFVLTRLFFGHHSDINFPRIIKCIFKIYCNVMPLIVLGLTVTLPFHSYYLLRIIPLIIEFVCYYITSMLTGDKYILYFFSYICITDKSVKSKEYFKKLYRLTTISLAIIILFQILVSFYFINEIMIGEVQLLAATFFRVYLDLAKLPMILVFTLLYCRVRLFRLDVKYEMETSRERPYKRNNHVLLYDSIYNSFENTHCPMKFLMFISCCAFFLNTAFPMILHLSEIKYASFQGYYNAHFILSCIIIVYNYAMTYCPAIVQEFILDELNQLNIYIVNHLSICSDARKRDELQQLQENMRCRPLEFRIWRILRVDASLCLNIVMLSVNVLILVLQFQNSNIEKSNASHITNSTVG